MEQTLLCEKGKRKSKEKKMIDKKEEEFLKLKLTFELSFMVMVAILLIPVTFFMNGYTFMKLWQWFVVPTFHLPVLSLVQALGLGMCVTFLTYKPQLNDNKPDMEGIKQMLIHATCWAFLKPIMTLCIGYIIKSLGE